MNSESSGEHGPERVSHTVVLTALREHADTMKVAQALARVGQLPVERVLRRLDSLPWTLTRQASAEKARLLTRRLEALGCVLTSSPALSHIEDQVPESTEALSAELPGSPPMVSGGGQQFCSWSHPAG